MALPLDLLVKSLADLHVSGKYSDLTIINGNKEYFVHKAIICGRSSFFTKACDGQFKEGLTSVIKIDEDDEEAVQMMIHYFYHLDYPRVQIEGATTNQDKDPAAENGEIEPCESPVVDSRWRRRGARKRTVKKLIFIEGTGLVYEEETPHTNEFQGSNLAMHARVYAFGEFYGVDGLKALALKKFKHEAGMFWNDDSFFQAAEIAYTSTPDWDTDLRRAILETLSNHRSILRKDTCKELIKNIEHLAYDLIIFLSENEIPKRS